jgi:hypothetical protein
MATRTQHPNFKERNTRVKAGEELPAVRKVKAAVGGNCKVDQRWIAEIGDDIVEVDQEDLKKLWDEIYWDIKYQFQGLAEEVEPAYFEEARRGTRVCSGVSYIRDSRGGYIIDLEGVRLQRPCLRNPALGAAVCLRHGAQTPHVRAAAIARLSHAAEKAANTLITLTDPRDELGEIVDQRVRKSAADSVLDRVGIRAGVEVEVEVPGYKKVMEKMFGAEEEPDADS